MRLPVYTTNDVNFRNAGILKAYSTDYFKLVQMRALRLPGYEERNATKRGRGCVGNVCKLSKSLSRSRARVFELAIANQWEHFVTLTISEDKLDRYDLDAAYKVIAKWINNSNSARASPVRYLLVPEPHQDGAWHFHGLITGIPNNELLLFGTSNHIPARIKHMLSDGRLIYNWLPYSARFGWVTAEKIRDHAACAKYMTKYITKELVNSSIKLEHHTYYCSKGLKRAETLYKGELRQGIEHPDFENDYVRTKVFGNAEEALQLFCDKEE